MLWVFIKVFALGLLALAFLPFFAQAWPYLLAALAVGVVLGLLGWPPKRP